MKLKVRCDCAVQFLAETTLTTSLGELLLDLTDIYNGILLIRLAAREIENFTKHLDDGPPKTAAALEGATSQDLEASKVLAKVTEEALARVSNAQLESGKCVTKALIESTKDMLKATLSAVTLPEASFQERDALTTRLDERHVEGSLSQDDAKLWWAGKELCRGNQLRVYFGSNEKTTVTVTLSSQPPARDKTAAETQFNEYLLSRMKRQKDFEDLEPDDESAGRDKDSLRKSVHGLLDIKWKP